MTKQDREKIRIEIAKKYKDEISELRRQNQIMSDTIIKLTTENRRLLLENQRINHHSGKTMHLQSMIQLLDSVVK